MANMESRRATMKSALAENLRELMTRKMYEKITIKQICDETGVIRATFYNYFDDKYDCLNWIIHIDFFSCTTLLESAGIREYAAALLHILDEEREFYRVGYGVVGQNSFQEMVTDNLTEVLKDYFAKKRKNGFMSHYSDELIAEYYAGGLSLILKKFVIAREHWSISKARQMIVDLLGHSFSEYLQ